MNGFVMSYAPWLVPNFTAIDIQESENEIMIYKSVSCGKTEIFTEQIELKYRAGKLQDYFTKLKQKYPNNRGLKC